MQASARGVAHAYFQNPVTRLQHVIATYRNIFGRNMLHAFGRPVAPCCDMLRVVGSNLTMFKFEPATPNRLAKRAQQSRKTEKKT